MMTKTNTYLEEVSKKTIAPYSIEASIYSTLKNGKLVWKNIVLAERNNKELFNQIAPSLLSKGQECEIKVKFSGADGSARFLIHWNNGKIMLGSYLNFDSESEAIEEGWL